MKKLFTEKEFFLLLIYIELTHAVNYASALDNRAGYSHLAGVEDFA